jgi:hypothetical protein
MPLSTHPFKPQVLNLSITSIDFYEIWYGMYRLTIGSREPFNNLTKYTNSNYRQELGSQTCAIHLRVVE